MANELYTTLESETFDENNVRVGYLTKEESITYKNVVQSSQYIEGETVDQIIPLIETTIECLQIYSYGEVSIKLNGSTDAITVDGLFVLTGTEITSLKISNAEETEVKINIVQGDVVVSA